MSSIDTLEDVQVFIDTLYATQMIWHADDLVLAIPNFINLDTLSKFKLQDLMNSAISVCDEHDVSIFDFYHDE